MIAAAVGAILLAAITLYATLGGADFGGGLWDLLAGGDRRGRAPRALIDESITPVWEANHVWLIFALVIFWTGFPDAFAAVMTAAIESASSGVTPRRIATSGGGASVSVTGALRHGRCDKARAPRRAAARPGRQPPGPRTPRGSA